MGKKAGPRRNITVRVSQDLARRLEALKDRDGTTMQHAAVTALESYLRSKGFPKKRDA